MALTKSPETSKKDKRAAFLMKLIKGAKAPFLPLVEYRTVQSVSELEQAGKLVYRQYLKKGYVPQEIEAKFIFQQATNLASTFVAVYKGRVLATVSLVQDSQLGLPMESECKETLDRLRKEGKKMAEVTMLAVNEDLLSTAPIPITKSDRVSLLMNLFKAMMDYNRAEGISDMWVASFLEKHDFFYEMLCFELLTSKSGYNVGPKKVRSRTRCLDVMEAIARGPKAFKIFFEFERNPATINLMPKLKTEEYLNLLTKIHQYATAI